MLRKCSTPWDGGLKQGLHWFGRHLVDEEMLHSMVGGLKKGLHWLSGHLDVD
jgi:hypothetical protein